jgi:hypothetical protein
MGVPTRCQIPWGLGFFSPNISDKTTHISWWYVTRHVVLQRRSNIHLDYAQDGENNVKQCKYWKYKSMKTWQYIFSALGWWWAEHIAKTNQSNPWAANQEWNQPDKWIKNRTHQVETQSLKQMHQHPRKYRNKSYNCSCSFFWCLKWKNTHPGPFTQQKTTSQLQAASPQHWKPFDPKSTVAHRTVARPRPLIASHFGSQRPQLMRGQSQRGVMGSWKPWCLLVNHQKIHMLNQHLDWQKRWTNKQGTGTTDRFIYNKSGHVVGESLQSTTQMTATPYE